MARSASMMTQHGSNLPARSLASLLVLLTTGCSFVGVNRAPAGYATRDHVECTSSNLAPILDTIGALGGAGVVVGGLLTAKSDSGLKRAAPVMGVSLISALILAGSAGYGYQTTESCRAMQLDAARRQALSLQAVDDEVGGQHAVGNQSAPVPRGCVLDTQCKGDRICVHGECVSPERTAVAPVEAPAKSPEPERTN